MLIAAGNVQDDMNIYSASTILAQVLIGAIDAFLKLGK